VEARRLNFDVAGLAKDLRNKILAGSDNCNITINNDSTINLVKKTSLQK